MPLQPADQITLTDAQRDILRSLERAHATPQQIVKRAQIILLADEGMGVNAAARRIGATARRIGCWGKMVRCWRKRWCAQPDNAQIMERLADEPRCGAPAKFTAEQICKIIALACRPPAEEEGGPPVNQWSQSDLAHEVIRQGIVDNISQRSVGRFLKKNLTSSRIASAIG